MFKNLILSVVMSATCGFGVINSSPIRSINYPSGSNDGSLWYGDFGIDNITSDAESFHTEIVLREGEVSYAGANSQNGSTNPLRNTAISKFTYEDNNNVYSNCLYVTAMDDYADYQESVCVVGNAHYYTNEQNQIYKRVFLKPYFRTNFMYEESEVSYLDTRYCFLKIHVEYPLASIPYNNRTASLYNGFPIYSTPKSASKYTFTNDFTSCEFLGNRNFSLQNVASYTFQIPLVRISSQGIDNLQQEYMYGWSHSYGISYTLSNVTTSIKPTSISYWFQWLDEEEYAAGYDSGYADGKTQGYNEGLAAGQSNNPQWLNLFGAVADTPVLMLRSLFNFDLFGMNLLAVVLSLITGIFVFAIFRKIVMNKG